MTKMNEGAGPIRGSRICEIRVVTYLEERRGQAGTQETGDGGVGVVVGLGVEAEEHGYLGASPSAGAGRSSSLYQ